MYQQHLSQQQQHQQQHQQQQPQGVRSAGSVSAAPATPFGTGADVMPPPLPENIQVKVENQTSSKVSHVSQNIASVLTVTMEGMVNRLADNNKASELEQVRIPGSVPTVDPASIAATAAAKQANAPVADAAAAASDLARATAAAAAAAAAKTATDVSADFGQTAQQMEAPDPPKSLNAQLDDMDAALGADSGPGAPKGLDQFLPQPVRVQNTLSLLEKFGSNAMAENMQGQHAHGSSSSSSSAQKAKSHAPSALLSSHWAPPPKVYQVPTSAHASSQPPTGAGAGAGAAQRITICAPSDEDLWLAEMQWKTGNNAASIHETASAPPMQGSVPKVPSLPLPPAKDCPLPWRGDTGSYVSTYSQQHPLEGAALQYNRAEQRTANAQAAQNAYEMRVQEMGQTASAAAAAPNSSSTSAAAPLSAGTMQRQQYLQKMQKIRQGMASSFA
jgi:hypothetical protein